MNEDSGSTLLVVDDESAVCRALRRMLRGRIERIMTAETPEDAETVLASTVVTHLICDHYLGPGQPLGMDLAAKWRVRYPNLKRVVVLTGKDVDGIEPASGIDHVLPKTTEPDRLAALLQLRGSERA
ncbi:MAG TPA: response regulator [Polyangia bacterium]|nr:response regulator [Polyangia bacterium]